MPVISLIALNDALGGTLPARARLSAVVTAHRTAGATVTLPRRVNVDIVGGVPLYPIDLAPSGVNWGWQLSLIDLVNGGVRVERLVTVPNVPGPIDWGDLVTIDPDTFDPEAEPEAAWWAAAIDDIELDGSNHLIFTTLGGTEYDAGLVPNGPTGAQGDPGDTNTAVAVSIGGALTINAAVPSTIRLTPSAAVSLNNLAAGVAAKSYTITLVIAQGATPYAVTFPANVKWAEAVIPVVPVIANTLHLYHFLWTGTEWLGLLGGISLA